MFLIFYILLHSELNLCFSKYLSTSPFLALTAVLLKTTVLLLEVQSRLKDLES